MSKTNMLPSVEDHESITYKRNTPKQKSSPEFVEVEGYVSRRIDAKLTRSQAILLRDKTRDLQDQGAKLASGRFVTNKTHAIQWMLENLTR